MEEPKLEKTLSYPVILIITINSILGTGIFFLPAVGARMSGPASLIAWAILSVVAIYISMFFAELTSMFPKAGGDYEFCKQAFGRFWSFSNTISPSTNGRSYLSWNNSSLLNF